MKVLSPRIRLRPAAPTRDPTGAAYLVGHFACEVGLAALLCALFALAVFSLVPGAQTLYPLLAAHTAQSVSFWCLAGLFPLTNATDWLGAAGLARRAWWLFWLTLTTLLLSPVTTVCY